MKIFYGNTIHKIHKIEKEERGKAMKLGFWIKFLIYEFWFYTCQISSKVFESGKSKCNNLYAEMKGELNA